MTYQAILAASVFLLLAFGIDHLGRASGIPAVILLIATGFVSKPLLALLDMSVHGVDVAVPILGAIGLVLIVLEGALDIELRRDKLRAAAGAVCMSVAGFVCCTVLFALVAGWLLDLTSAQSLLVAIPFAVISSAVAIPSAHFFPAREREFVIYESAVSDILGILLFYSVLESDGTTAGILVGLIGGGVLSLLASIICALGLLAVLVRIDGDVRFIPLLAALVGLYAAGKLLHLSPLILVLLFGLALNNSAQLARVSRARRWLGPNHERNLEQFKMLALELTFAVRGFFFILLGYWTDADTLLSAHSWLTATAILATIYFSRYVLLRLLRVNLAAALTWVAPRGLITVLLFLAAREKLALPQMLDGAVMLVVLFSASLIALARHRAGIAADATQTPATP